MAAGKIYDVIIVGGGITGASLFYVLGNYSNVKEVLLLEKYGDLAQLNSDSSNNAQTLHFGDIETNYSLEQAKNIKEAATRILKYSEKIPPAKRSSIIKKCQKMVLAVGENEIEMLNETYRSIKPVFPGLKSIGKKELERIEPNTIRKRDPAERVSALLSDNGYTVDFGRLTRSFVENAGRGGKSNTGVLFNTKVLSIKETSHGYELITAGKSYSARFVVFATGTYSLYFAKSLGYDKNLSMLSIGGNFYTAPAVLKGKVYRVQIGGIPFAAVHGDPDFNNPKITRFGPTVTMPLTLEKYHGGTFWDYARSFDFDMPTLISLKRIVFNKDIGRILSKNLLYAMPVVGKYGFLKMEASSIVPSLRYGDLTFGKHIGGIRPQIIDENKRSLILGAGKIKEKGLIFNITPSPGASSCLESALEDALTLKKYLDRDFDVEKFEKELGRIGNKRIRQLF